MIPNLPKELSDALHESGDTLEVLDPVDNRTYFLVDNKTHRKAMEALKKEEDCVAIQNAIDQADRGETMSLEEADARLRKKFNFPSR